MCHVHGLSPPALHSYRHLERLFVDQSAFRVYNCFRAPQRLLLALFFRGEIAFRPFATLKPFVWRKAFRSKCLWRLDHESILLGHAISEINSETHAPCVMRVLKRCEGLCVMRTASHRFAFQYPLSVPHSRPWATNCFAPLHCSSSSPPA